MDGVRTVGNGQARGETRFIGDLMGSYVLASRALQPEGLTRLACRARSISVREATITAPVVGSVGEALTVAFQPLGILRGEILRRVDSGFIMSFDVDEAERETLEARIHWLKRKALRAVHERRAHKRVIPRETRSRLVVGAGQFADCFIMDMSRSGVAVSADIKPPVGTLVGVGAVPGRVIRHFECGFAVQFSDLQELEHLEGLLTLKTGEHKQLAAEKLGFSG